MLLLQSGNTGREIMSKALDFFEIDRFARGAEIPMEAVTEAVISGVRQLDEVTELEIALREILGAPDVTPHGPTELEDIFQTGVTVNGKPRVAAFIIKGKSFDKVTSKLIGNQILRLQDVPDLSVAVLCAVGHIHDDAKKHFIQTANSRNADYLVMDAMTTARLLIAYEKICPQDGTPYNGKGICRGGHVRESGTAITWRVNEEAATEPIRLQDTSTPNAKRYSAFLLIDRHYDRSVIRRLVATATAQLKSETYQRPGPMQELWAHHPAQVIWTFVGRTVEDSQQGNWLCRSLWIDPALSENRPHPLGGEMVDGIEFIWNSGYQSQVEFVAKNKASKGVLLQQVEEVFSRIMGLGSRALEIFELFDGGQLSEAELAAELQQDAASVRDLYHRCSDFPFGPADTNEVVEHCGLVAGSVDELFDSYSERAMRDTNPMQRRVRFETGRSTLRRDLKRWEVEWEKVHR